MSTDVAVAEPREIVITDEQTDLIKRTICKDATDAEMRLFFFDCQRRGVHPLDRLIHFTKRSGKYTPITSIDFMRQRAASSQVFAGEDEPLYTYTPNGNLLDTCTYAVYRLVQGQRYKWTATARWAEYFPGDQLGFMWRKMPFVMLTKCAEALALRKAFPAELQGLYVKEEMDQAELPKPSRKPSDILAEHEAQLVPQLDNAGGQAAPPDGLLQTTDTAEAPQPIPALPFTDCLERLRLCETIREYSELMNGSLNATYTPEQRTAVRDLGTLTKKRLTGKR